MNGLYKSVSVFTISFEASVVSRPCQIEKVTISTRDNLHGVHVFPWTLAEQRTLCPNDLQNDMNTVSDTTVRVSLESSAVATLFATESDLGALFSWQSLIYWKSY